jgi:dTDP-4-amino-4,6-dideoxygalactose transaminase
LLQLQRRGFNLSIPLCKPSPAKLSESASRLREIEERSIFSNFGPVNTSLERNLTDRIFGGVGECLTVCNATIGLMLAIRQAVESHPNAGRRYALMPSFTFAAVAQAALWNQLTPLFCDINPEDWSADPASEQRLLDKHHGEIAVVVPYATFGYDIDLSRYEDTQCKYGIPVVVDAAASLGTISEDGRGFGAGFSGAVVYSMHVTKAFATGEGGLVYSADSKLITTLRSMSNFGFGEPRNATMMGLNGKMSEVTALLASLRLENFDGVMQRRSRLVELYREALPELSFQPLKAHRQAHQFTATLLPPDMAAYRAVIQLEMRQRGVDSATYFSPHVAEQDYFRSQANPGALPVTNEIASRALTLPLYDTMIDDEVQEVVAAVKAGLALCRQTQAATRKLSAARG